MEENLPPERRLPDPDAMLETILADEEDATPPRRRPSAIAFAAAAGISVLALGVGFATVQAKDAGVDITPAQSPSASAPSGEPTASRSPSSEPTRSPRPSEVPPTSHKPLPAESTPPGEINLYDEPEYEVQPVQVDWSVMPDHDELWSEEDYDTAFKDSDPAATVGDLEIVAVSSGVTDPGYFPGADNQTVMVYACAKEGATAATKIPLENWRMTTDGGVYPAEVNAVPSPLPDEIPPGTCWLAILGFPRHPDEKPLEVSYTDPEVGEGASWTLER